MTDERLKAIMADLGMPCPSKALLGALRQVADETSQECRTAHAAIVAGLERQRDNYKAADWAMQEQCASLRVRLNDVGGAAIERLKTSPAEGHKPAHGGRPA